MPIIDNSDPPEEFDGESRSIIMDVIAQLSRGIDFHRVSLPTFVLEPRSLLERITDFLVHPDLLSRAALEKDPVARFMDIVRFYLSGWHLRPKGLKKPYNPILGEFFRCHWTCSDGSRSYYLAEQVSHHPPISAYVYVNERHGVMITGNIKPRGKFLGNSVVSVMQGEARIALLNDPKLEFIVTYPNIYARGILFGTKYVELGDKVSIICKADNIMAELDFKIKGYFSGSINEVHGVIKRLSTQECLYEITGNWAKEVLINEINGPTKSFWKVTDCPLVLPDVPPSNGDDHSVVESRYLWRLVTEALLKDDFSTASKEKAKIEEQQRQITKGREESQSKWRSRFFAEDLLSGFWFFGQHGRDRASIKELVAKIASSCFANFEAQDKKTSQI